MKRREFITLLGGVATTWPLTARAQQQAMPVIGFLRSTSPDGAEHLVAAFREGLKGTGYVEGQTVAIEYRWARSDVDMLPVLATDLVRRQVNVIVANGVAAGVAKAATATIPIVFIIGIDPVRSGLVASLNRPGGNVTGISIAATDLDAKRVEVLHELVPNAHIIAVLLDPNVVETGVEIQAVQRAGQVIGQEVMILKAARESELDAAFSTMAQSRAGALLVGGGAFFVTQRRRLVALATHHGISASYMTRDSVEVGGLMSYGPSQVDAYRRAGIYVGRILNGANPANCPSSYRRSLSSSSICQPPRHSVSLCHRPSSPAPTR